VRSQALRLTIAALAFLTSVTTARAQVADSAGPPGSELTIYLMTIGQGDYIWERYGHNAIGIRDNRTGQDVVFNWGLFSFEEPGFLGKFLRGENMYWMGGQDAAATLEYYRSQNRTVEVQELNLSPPQRLAIRDFILNNAREENKYYKYDYFRDNCSTRARDALDGTLGGALRMATDSVKSGASYRWHALRLMAEDRLASVGINIGLGRPTDREISQWEEMFIPMKVRDRIRELRVPDDFGRPVPLVTSERVLFQAQRTPERESPPPQWISLGILGLLAGAGLAQLGRRTSRAALPLTLVVAGFLGLMGWVLLFLRFMTPHVAAWGNTNLFVYNPLWLAVLVAMPLVRQSGRGRQVVFVIASIAGVLTAFGIIAPFIPGFAQGSFAVIAMAAPSGLAAAWIIRERTRPVVTSAT
jgi:hypothetical protein